MPQILLTVPEYRRKIEITQRQQIRPIFLELKQNHSYIPTFDFIVTYRCVQILCRYYADIVQILCRYFRNMYVGIFGICMWLFKKICMWVCDVCRFLRRCMQVFNMYVAFCKTANIGRRTTQPVAG